MSVLSKNITHFFYTFYTFFTRQNRHFLHFLHIFLHCRKNRGPTEASWGCRFLHPFYTYYTHGLVIGAIEKTEQSGGMMGSSNGFIVISPKTPPSLRRGYIHIYLGVSGVSNFSRGYFTPRRYGHGHGRPRDTISPYNVVKFTTFFEWNNRGRSKKFKKNSKKLLYYFFDMLQ